MLTYSNTATNGSGVNATSISAAFVAATAGTAAALVPGFFLWNATAQSIFANGNGGNVIINAAERTSTTCYMKGLSEHLQISTSSGLPWFWRRICFTHKFPLEYPTGTDTAPVTTPATYVDTSNGIERLFFNSSINATPLYQAGLYELIFKGKQAVDWTDPILAPTDPTRITVKYDKTTTIKSGNQVGTHREVKMFHPMNHNLVYSDDEVGAGENGSYVSVSSKSGMGNFFVLDLFSPLPNQGSATDILRINANSTLYWHEK